MSPPQYKVMTMSHASELTPADGDGRISQEAIDSIGLRVDFQLGNATIPLREMRAMQPGYLFEFEADLSAPVILSVHNVEIGRGELVRIGNSLGVRVKELTSNGIQPS